MSNKPAPDLGAEDDLILIGELGAPHGIKGELRLFPLSDVPKRFENLDEVIWVGPEQQKKRLKVAALRQGERFWLIRFAEYDQPEEASRLTKGRLAVAKSERGTLPAGNFFIDDIIGLQVWDEQGSCLGQVAEIMQTGAHDIYLIRRQNVEWLLPALKSVVLKIDIAAGQMIVRVPEGLDA